MRIDRKKLVALLLLLSTAVTLLSIYTRRPNQPSWHGRKLSQWIFIYVGTAYSPPPPPEVELAATAIRSIGTNGLPFLLEWLKYDTPHPSPRTVSIFTALLRPLAPIAPVLEPVARVIDSLFQFTQRSRRAGYAAAAFKPLGPLAAPAVPELSRLAIESPSEITSYHAAEALVLIGKPALPAILQILRNSQDTQLLPIIYAIPQLGSNAQPLIPHLTSKLQNTNGLIAFAAARTLGRLKLEPETVIPALVATLHHKDQSALYGAMYSLRQFGQNARHILPELTNFLASPNPDTRTQALNTIKALSSTPEPTK